MSDKKSFCLFVVFVLFFDVFYLIVIYHTFQKIQKFNENKKKMNEKKNEINNEMIIKSYILSLLK